MPGAMAMRKRKSTVLKCGAWFTAAFAVVGLFAAPVDAKPPKPGPNAPGQSGFTGPEGVRVDSVNVPARIFRVAAVPGSERPDFWAMGRVTSYQDHWNDTDTGQLVFLRNYNNQGWDIVGAAKAGAADDKTSVFTAFALASTGQGTEGWAVGDGGKAARLAPGTNEWVTTTICPSSGCVDLYAIALSKDGSVGYAVGAEGTVMRLSNGTWTADPAIPARGSSVSTSPVTGPTSRPILTGVAVTTGGEAWAIASDSTDPNNKGIELYRRNSSGTWELKQTGIGVFDSPPTISGDRVRVAVHGATAAAGPNTIWFSGHTYPFDPANPSSNSDPATHRPFVLRYKVQENSFTAYCTPGGFGAASGTAAGSTCGSNSGELPPGGYSLPALTALDSGDVFAGGLGLLHFKQPTAANPLGRWFREPNPVGYLMSIAFRTSSEGWMAGTGGAYAPNLTSSSGIAVGHYTKDPAGPERVARWSFPTDSLLPYAVATSPGGDAVAPPIAVGENGMVMTKTNVGWDETGKAEATSGAGFTQLAVAYVGNTDLAWAVGDAGKAVAINNGRPINPHPTLPSNATLYGVAFSTTGVGYAVGQGGAIVRYNGGSAAACATTAACWTADTKADRTLWSVAAIGSNSFVAVGDAGTVLLKNGDGPWTKVSYVSNTLLARPGGEPPALYAVDSLPGGDFVIGGDRSALVVARKPKAGESTDGANFFGGYIFELAPNPQEGAILALSARSTTPLKLVASLAPTGTSKFALSQGSATSGWLVDFDGARWSDLQRSSNRSKPMAALDDAMSRDPVYTIAADPDGRSGWAVGGLWAGQRYEAGTRSMYRFDLDGSPRSPADAGKPVVADTPPGGFSFAFFSDTACGAALCSLSAGTGTAADEVALRIREDINAAHRNDPVNGPQFVLFGGNARGVGSAEELGQFAAYLSGFDIPVFGVPGSRDMTPPPASANPPVGVPFGLTPPQTPNSTRDRSAYLTAFGGMRAPWGIEDKEEFKVLNPQGKLEDVVLEPVELPPPACSGCARTHYAFDYTRNGKALARFVFLDTSDGTLNGTNQSPAEQQGQFLSRVLPEGLRGKLASFIVMNTPPRDPSTFSNNPILPAGDVALIEQVAFTAGTSAVFAGGVRMNGRYSLPEGVSNSVTYYVSGGGGSPLDGTARPSDARYNSWLLASVNPNVGPTTLRAPTTVRSIPVLESVYFLKDEQPAWKGQQVINIPGGTAVRLSAGARSIDGGGRAGDRRAMNRLYLGFPLGFTCEGGGDNPNGGGCFNKRGIPPDFRFVSENPAIADFVYSGGSFSPVRSSGRLVKDPMSGLLCTFRTGQVTVRIESGGRVSRLQLNVVPGEGPCVIDPVTEFTELAPLAVVPDALPEIRPAPNQPPAPTTPKAAKITPPAPPPKPVVPAPPQPEPTPVAKPAPKIFMAPSPLAEIVPALMPPAPSLLPSPAPPASATAAGAQKQEDKEVEHESAGQEGGEFTAIRHRRDYAFDPAMGWMLMSVATLLGVFGAAIAATKKGGAGRPAQARVTYPREL